MHELISNFRLGYETRQRGTDLLGDVIARQRAGNIPVVLVRQVAGIEKDGTVGMPLELLNAAADTNLVQFRGTLRKYTPAGSDTPPVTYFLAASYEIIGEQIKHDGDSTTLEFMLYGDHARDPIRANACAVARLEANTIVSARDVQVRLIHPVSVAFPPVPNGGGHSLLVSNVPFDVVTLAPELSNAPATIVSLYIVSRE